MTISYSTDGGRNWSSIDALAQPDHYLALLAVAERLLTSVTGPQPVTHIAPRGDPHAANYAVHPTRLAIAYQAAIGRVIGSNDVPAATVVDAADRWGTVAQRERAYAFLSAVRGDVAVVGH